MRGIANALSMPVWQNVLIVHGCQLDTGHQTLPLRLDPVGETLHCTPTCSGSILPFNVPVFAGQTVIISWDREASRYVLSLDAQTAA